MALEQGDVRDAFLQAMRRFATTIAVISAAEGDAWQGMTATSVASVSADPPSVVIGVNQQAGVHGALHTGERFCVNLLRLQHAPLVGAFSGALQGRERFSAGDWRLHSSGVPYLEDALAALFCTVRAQLAYGTHTLFVGEVDDLLLAEGADPLLWQNGALAFAAPYDPKG